MTPLSGSGTAAEHDELPSTDPGALDRLRRFGGNKLLSEMISLFTTAVPERLGAARAGLEAGDARVTELALHSLKSSSAQLGALRMQRLSEEGELIARTGSLVGVDALVTQLESEYPSVQAWLERARTAVSP